MPKLETIRVARGDFNKTYLLVQERGARNRPLNPRKLKSIAANWQDASKDTVTLIRSERGYLIADGQHRIAAASAYFRHPVTLKAMVWEESEVTDFADFITAFNRGTPFNTSSLLQVYQERSIWPRLAAEAELPVTFQRFRATKFSWTAVLRGVALADGWRDGESFAARSLRKEEITSQFWLGYTEEGIREVIAALKWWYPVADAGYRSLHRSGAMFSDVAIAVALSVYRKYHTRPVIIERVRERLLASNQLAVLKMLDQKQMRWFARAILAGFNYKVSKEFVELYGETGRD